MTLVAMTLLVGALIVVPSQAARIVQSGSTAADIANSERSTLEMTGESLLNESSNATSSPKWAARLSHCDATCGKGKHKVIFAVCMKSGKIIPDIECKGARKPKDKDCELNVGCEWRVAGKPASNCGWAREVECWARDGTAPLDSKFCRKIIEASEEQFMLREGLTTTACTGNELKHVCAATMHHEGGLFSSAQNKAKQLVADCGTADAIVIASQGKEASFGKGIGPYVLVEECGGKISASVSILVHETKQHLFAPVAGTCKTEDRAGNSFLTPGLFRSKRGSVILNVHSLRGNFVAASSHGPGGIPTNPDRIEALNRAMKHVREFKPAYVVWGGDFDIQRPFNADEAVALLTVGATHPTAESGAVDQQPAWTASYDPKAVYGMLASFPEVFGNESFAQEVFKGSMGALVEVGGVRSHCPTNGKAETAGNVEGSGGLFGLFGKKKEKKWLANLACQVPGQFVEFYKSPLDLKTTWDGEKSDSPFWPDRLVVQENSMKCAAPSKIKVEEGHDVVYSLCTLGSTW